MYVVLREGEVSFYAPDLSRYVAGGRIEPAWAPVFYNPAMANNRSVSVIVVRAYLNLIGLSQPGPRSSTTQPWPTTGASQS